VKAISGRDGSPSRPRRLLGDPDIQTRSSQTPALPPLTGTTEVGSVGIARATKGDATPTGEKFCEILRQLSATCSRITSIKSDADPILSIPIDEDIR